MHLKRAFLALLVGILLLGCFVGCSDPSDGEVEWQDLVWAVGAPLPTAEDFARSLPEGAEVSFAEQYSFPSVGEYELTLLYQPKRGRALRVTVSLTLVKDSTPPVLIGVDDITGYVGDGISYRSGVTLRDDCHNPVTLSVDSSAVDLRREGSYPVIYRAVDGAGNVTEKQITVYLYEERITEEQLFSLIAPVAQRICPAGLSRREQIEEIYDYVYFNVDYVSTSDKSDWVRAAYEGLRTGSGDCFTYFALSKAFFTYLGIENMDIHRTEGIVEERHYWNLVNLSTDPASPRWYHFDATPLLGSTHSGCLLTDAQIAAYSASRVNEDGVGNYFYAYDRKSYPASDTTVINHTLAS